MKLNEKIKWHRLELGLSADAVAKELGISRATLYRYESGDIEKIPTNLLPTLSRILHTDVGDLISVPQTTLLPMRGTACNQTTLIQPELVTDFFCAVNADAQFCLRMAGDSMRPSHIDNNDVVFIRTQQELTSGDIGAMLLDNMIILQKIRKMPGKIILVRENTSPCILPFPSPRLQILGKAVAVQHTLQ